MAIDKKKLQALLTQIENDEKQSEASKYIWKPKEGLNNVRIVPYKFNPDNPLVRLEFYYKIGGKNYLAPCGFGKPDPIQEFVEKLRSSGVQSQRAIAKELEAKPRTYVPIIVRGEEDRGVRFWGFGATVYKQLLKLMLDPDWGDITSLTEGNDIKIEFKKESNKKNKDGKSFPETTITPIPRKSPVVDPKNKELMAKVEDQVDIMTIWPLPEYDELKSALDRYLNPETDSSDSSDPSDEDADDTAPVSVSDENVIQGSKKDPGQEFAEFFGK